MTTTLRKAIREAQVNVRKRARFVENKLTRAGVKPDPAVVFSTSQYFEALKKLAKK